MVDFLVTNALCALKGPYDLEAPCDLLRPSERRAPFLLEGLAEPLPLIGFEILGDAP
jgi:hypothetical protein